MKGYEALAAALVAEGVDTIFGVLGGGILDLARVLADQHGVRFVGTRHEDVAIGMADGYSRVSGKIGVALICIGPGLANALGGMIAARMAKSRLLVVVGGMVDVDPHHNMSIDQRAVLGATIQRYEELARPEQMTKQVSMGFRHLRSGKGPMALHFCNAEAEFPAGWSYTPLPALAPPAPPQPSEASIAELVTRIEAAKKPILLAGNGAVAADARAALLALAEKAGALVTTSLLARDWFSGEAFNIGLSGGFSTDDTIEIVRECDLVIAFGAGMNQHTTAHGSLFTHADIVQVDVDADAIGLFRKPVQAVVADARATAEALTAALPQQDKPGWRDEAMATRIANFDRWRGRDLSERQGYVNPRLLVDVIERHAPDERIFLSDIGLFMGVPASSMTVPDPRSMLMTWQLGRIGSALPLALGAALARPDRLVTAFVGDGGMMASIAALDTMATLGVPLLLFVMDDNGLSGERRVFRLMDTPSTIADHRTPDLVTIARTMGIAAHRIGSLAEAEDLLSREPLRDQATLFQVAIDPDVETTEIDRAFYVMPEAPPVA